MSWLQHDVERPQGGIIHVLLPALLSILAFGTVSAQTDSNDCFRRVLSASRELAPTPSQGEMIRTAYSITKIARRGGGFDTSTVKYEVTLSGTHFHLRTDMMEIHRDTQTAVVVFPRRNVVSISSVSLSGDSFDRNLRSMRMVQDSLLSLVASAECRDSSTSDGRSFTVVSCLIDESRRTGSTPARLTFRLEADPFPERIVIDYPPSAELVRSEIVYRSVERLAETPEDRRPVLSMFDPSVSASGRNYEGFRRIDNR